MGQHTVSISLLRFLKLFFIFLLLWGILVRFSLESLWIGVPTVLVCTRLVQITSRHYPPLHLSIIGTFRFLFFFITHAVWGGVDVLIRAFKPKLSLSPGFFKYNVSLTHPISQTLLLTTISMIPGTLSVNLSKNTIAVHTLSTDANNVSEIKETERLIKNMMEFK